MSSKLRNTLTPFLAGCLVTSGALLSQGVVGTSGVEPETERVIKQAVSDTAQAVVMSLEKKEQERLDQIPDPLNCNSFSWMESCEEINRQAKLNPQAPMRVQRQDGLEFNFPPGTPTAVINAMLSDNPAATEAMIDYLDDLSSHHSKLASQFEKSMWARGGLQSVESSADRASAQMDAPRDTIDPDKVKVTLLYDSRCSACKVTLRNLQQLRERYPEVSVSAFQFDGDKAALKETEEMYNVDARILTSEETARLKNSGITTVPTMWIDNPSEKRRLERSGAISLTVIENELERVSNYKSGGRG